MYKVNSIKLRTKRQRVGPLVWEQFDLRMRQSKLISKQKSHVVNSVKT